jgi:hypothetical protein
VTMFRIPDEPTKFPPHDQGPAAVTAGLSSRLRWFGSDRHSAIQMDREGCEGDGVWLRR